MFFLSVPLCRRWLQLLGLPLLPLRLVLFDWQRVDDKQTHDSRRKKKTRRQQSILMIRVFTAGRFRDNPPPPPSWGPNCVAQTQDRSSETVSKLCRQRGRRGKSGPRLYCRSFSLVGGGGCLRLLCFWRGGVGGGGGWGEKLMVSSCTACSALQPQLNSRPKHSDTPSPQWWRDFHFTTHDRPLWEPRSEFSRGNSELKSFL